MKILFKILFFLIVAAIAGYLLFVSDMSWDKNQKKIVPKSENTTKETFDLSLEGINIDDLPKEVVDKMKNRYALYEAVATALEENGFSKNEKIRFVKYIENPNTGDLEIHLVFGATENRLIYYVVEGEPVKYHLTKRIIEKE